jgi:hypothetical protein
MLDGRRKQLTVILGGGLVVGMFLACGCAIKHSDVMVFGTNTKYGLSIAADQPENTPHVNLGYKRQEFVWMPLVANGADSKLQEKVTTGATPQDLKYIGKEPVANEDTYSVLASFGANFNAGGTGGTGGGIAQYFATGLAARKLAQVGGASLVQASNIDLTPKTELSKDDREALNRLLHPTPAMTKLKDQLAQLLTKNLKPDTKYKNKTYEKNQIKQYANDYVQGEIDPNLTAGQIYATGTEDQLKKLVDQFNNVAEQGG